MGNFLSSGARDERKVLLIGMEGSGKTTFLQQTMFGEVTQPPVESCGGSGLQTVSHHNIDFTVWDMKGQEAARPLWRNYYPNAQAIIFVIDSTNQDLLPAAIDELSNLLTCEEIQDSVPVLILVNKQDHEASMSVDDISSQFPFPPAPRWHVQPTSALQGTGICEAWDW